MEYITGMDTRIGYPNEHLAGGSDDEIASPLFATAVGLVMDGLQRQDRALAEEIEEAESANELESNDSDQEEIMKEVQKERRSFLDKLTEKVKDFLDNAE